MKNIPGKIWKLQELGCFPLTRLYRVEYPSIKIPFIATKKNFFSTWSINTHWMVFKKIFSILILVKVHTNRVTTIFVLVNVHILIIKMTEILEIYKIILNKFKLGPKYSYPCQFWRYKIFIGLHLENPKIKSIWYLPFQST